MKGLVTVVTAVATLALAGQARAADVEAGRAKAEACFACHGRTGVSVSPEIPNLAGQKAQYLENQLKAFRAKTRTNPLMNAMAAQLSDGDIADLAAFFNSLPGASGDAVSELPEDINRTRVAFPTGYAETFTYYTTINFPDRGQVRRYLANETALRAAAAGEPLPDGSMHFVEVYKAKLDAAGDPVTGADGFYEPDELVAFTAMERQPGWGEAFPEKLRNGDWNYAVFTADGSLREGVNQAQCLACHKPLAEASYVFTLEQLQNKARAVQ